MDIQDIKKAEKRLEPVLLETPLIYVPGIEEYSLYIKPENTQKTGSFKIRGAYNKMCVLSEEEKSQGVIASSAGNHAQGVAFAAKRIGVHATLCMPKSTPKVKIEATKSYGADVVLVDGVYDDAYQEALRLQEKFGYTFIHPYNDDDVIAGQGTIGLEILNENIDIDTVIVPVGGGGLISGVACAIKSLRPNAKVYGVQASGAPGMYASYAAGYVKKIPDIHTLAEGIAVKEVGDLALKYVSKYVDDIITVDDETIMESIRRLFHYGQLVSEGAGAAGIAALIDERLPLKGRKVAAIVSGGNIDKSLFSKLMI